MTPELLTSLEPIDLTKLPDYAALRQLAAALWREPGERGAAALVGAGFSKNARSKAGDVQPPLSWDELASRMSGALYAEGETPPNDPLRLAEEFRIYFGQAALDDFMRSNLPDAAWDPGARHHSLVRLPWADLLTTNFDTLLERASAEIASPSWKVVRSEGDLARYSSPRIVKLHGTLGVDTRLVIAEEDFRTYPARHAAFVNLARQVFIENELCLFGFSGDDPNFLAWSGWVRDHLAGAARRIYLVGVLRLSPAKRKLLEARNISPIDLWPAVKHLHEGDRHGQATDAVLELLHRSKPVRPYDWMPAPPDASSNFDARMAERKDPSLAADRIRGLIAVWRQDRLSYPGWITPPSGVRGRLRESLDEAPTLTEDVEQALTAAERTAYAREIAWRYGTANTQMDRDDREKIGELLDQATYDDLSLEGGLEVATVLMREARYADDRAAFDHWADYASREVGPGSDAAAQVAYQRCLWARDRLDDAAVDALIDKLDGLDPIWGVRAAGLLAEMGRISDAAARVRAAVSELRSRSRALPSSVWVKSRLAWAEWIAAAVQRDENWKFEPWGNEYRDWKSDPFELIEGIQSEARSRADAERAKQRKVIPSFEEGHYRDPGQTIQFRSRTHATTFFKARRLLEDTGAPLRLRRFSLASEMYVEAGMLDSNESAAWHLLILRGLGRINDSRYSELFSRIAVARLDSDVAAELTVRLLAAIRYWQAAWTDPERYTIALDRLPYYLETAARLIIRAPAVVCVEAFQVAMNLANDARLRHHALNEPLGHLAYNAIRALPRSTRATLALQVLDFPLPDEGGTTFRWPEPSEWLSLMDLSAVRHDVAWDARIEQLIRAAGQGGQTREHACLRLTQLSLKNTLTEDQAGRWGAALWSRLDDIDPPLPVETGLYAYTFAFLPHPPEVEAAARVQRRLYERLALVGSADLLSGWVAAASPNAQGRQIGPTLSQSTAMFDQLVTWRPAAQPHTASARLSAMFSGESEERTARAVGSAMAVAISPWMEKDERTSQRVSSYLALLEVPETQFGLGGLVWFVHTDQRTAILERLRQGLLSVSFVEVAGACDAVATWLRNTETLGPVNADLIWQLISQFETVTPSGLHLIGRTLRKLLAANQLSDEQINRIRPALGRLFDQTDYEAVELGGRFEVTASLLRAECVRLSMVLEDRSSSPQTARWIEAARTDPLPEVRDALTVHSSQLQADRHVEAS